MEIPESDYDKLIFFEKSRMAGEATYAINPLDSDNLMRWGIALLQLAQFQSLPDSTTYIQDAISKLQESLVVDPKKGDTYYYLGNAYTSHAFSVSDANSAGDYFAKAIEYYRQALSKDPDNETYKNAMEVAIKGPDSHKKMYRNEETHQVMPHQQPASSRSTSASSSSSAFKVEEETKELPCNIFSWVVLAVCTVACIFMGRSHQKSRST